MLTVRNGALSSTRYAFSLFTGSTLSSDIRVEYNLITAPCKDYKKKAGRLRAPPVESLDDLPDALAPDAFSGDHEGYDHRYAREVEHFQPLSLRLSNPAPYLFMLLMLTCNSQRRAIIPHCFS